MTSLQLAQQEWEAKTKPHTKSHPLGRNVVHEHEFRQFGQAIAWLKWDGGRIEIAKFESLQPKQGAGSLLIEFLKTLADKYQIQLWGHSRPYSPDPPVPNGQFLSKEKLENFYMKRGFQLRKIDAETSEICYTPRK
jgi:hypothetical protein